jgi:hypothetical protein
MNNFSGIFHDGLLMQVNVSFWSGARILKPEDLGLDQASIVDAFHLGRKLLIPQKVIHAFRHIEGQARALVAKNSFPFPIGNARFVPRRCFNEVNAQLEAYKAEYMRLAEDLITRYDEYRNQMLPIYQGAAENAFETANPPMQEFGVEDLDQLKVKRENDKAAYVEAFLNRIKSYYPQASSLRAKFGLDWSIYEIAVPRMELTEAGEIIATEKANESIHRQMNEKIGTFVDDVVRTLRQETTEICGNIVKFIKEGKVIRSTTMDSLRDFIERFKTMNFVGDATIESQLEAVRNEFLNMDSKTISEDDNIREALSTKLSEVLEVAEKIGDQDINGVTSQYVRTVNWA